MYVFVVRVRVSVLVCANATALCAELRCVVVVGSFPPHPPAKLANVRQIAQNRVRDFGGTSSSTQCDIISGFGHLYAELRTESSAGRI